MQPSTPRRSAYFWVAWVSLLALSAQQQIPDEDYEIVQVTEFVRHGARSSSRNLLRLNLPDYIQPGTLTANGMRMQYELGVQIRKKYPEIFDREVALTPADIQVYSSPLPRCIESAVSQLMGLMPSDKYPYNLTIDSKSKYALPPFGDVDPTWESSWALPFGYRPFPMTVKSTNIDLFFFSSPSLACPKATNKSTIFKKKRSEELRSLWKPVSDELVSLGFDPKLLINQDEFNLLVIGSVYDEIKAYKYYWGKLPEKISEDLFDRLHKLASIEFSNFFESDNYVRLFTHEISAEILAGFETATSTKQPKSKILYRLFSGHDSTIFAFQMALNRTSHQCLVDKANGTQIESECLGLPEFASSWLFELRRHKQSKEYFVKFLNDGKTVIGLCPSQSVSNPYCKYSEFLALFKRDLQFKNSTAGDYVDYCGNQWLRAFTADPTSNDQPASQGPGKLLLVGLSAVILLLVGVLALLFLNPNVVNHLLKDNSAITGSYMLPEQEASMNQDDSLNGSKTTQEPILR